MKYVLLFCGTAEDQAAFDRLSPDDLKARYGEVARWFQEHRNRIGGSNQLQGPHTATTVRFDAGGKPAIKDGPFMAGKEIAVGSRRGLGRPRRLSSAPCDPRRAAR
jgi:hypothetical protein